MSCASIVEKVKLFGLSFKNNKFSKQKTNLYNQNGPMNINAPLNNKGNITYNNVTKLYSEDISHLVKKYFLDYKEDELKFNSNSYEAIINWIQEFKLKLKLANIQIKHLKNEKLLKILDFLSIILLDEEKDIKEKFYIYDIKNILDKNNYITLSDKLSFSQIQLVIQMTKNYLEVIQNEKLLNFYKENNFYPYIDCRTLAILNSSKENDTLGIVEGNTGHERPINVSDLENDFLFQYLSKDMSEETKANYVSLEKKFFCYSGTFAMNGKLYLDLSQILKFDFFDVGQQPIFTKKNDSSTGLGLITNQFSFVKPTEKSINFLHDMQKN